MDKKEFLQFRKCRRDIINMCYRIYDYDIGALEKHWKVVKKNIGELLDEQVDLLLSEISECINKRNWIRIRDVLLQLDDIIRKELKQKCSVFQLWREDIWEENYALLRERSPHLADKVLDMKDDSRIEVLAGGTECCVIRIYEGDMSFQLFSSENPWLECTDRIAYAIAQTPEYSNIYQLGFNGGFLTGAITEKFPTANINVYVPNLDIFTAVLHNICLAEVLNRDNLYFFYDPTGLDFAQKVSSSTSQDRSVFIVDKIEYRALLRGNIDYTKVYFNTNKSDVWNIGTIGEKIYSAIDI